MKYTTLKKFLSAVFLCLICLLCIASCGSAGKKKTNSANLNLDIGIGISHFENESDYPEPSADAKLDVYSSKIIIREAYDDKIIETPLIYNNSSTAHPRMQLRISGNRLYVVYCPDISLPSIQLASTDDGGETWIQSTLNLEEDSVGTIDVFESSFWSTRNGALIIANGMVDTFIYFTDDSGKTWQKAEGVPPSQNWHDSLYSGVFLSSAIGFATYNFYSYPPNEPQIYITLDGSVTWDRLAIKVPSSVMTAYALAGTPFYDGIKINIPIELYDENDQLTDIKYYVSYDFGENWEFYTDEEDLQLIRNDELGKWFESNRPAILADKEYSVSDFSLYSSFSIEENVRIDAYKLVVAYDISDWSTLHLTGEMYFDAEANLYYKGASGFPILLFVYEGDVFDHSYYLLGSSNETQYKTEGEDHLAKRLYEEYVEHKTIKTLFNEARGAYSWFTAYAHNLVYTGDSMEYDGEKYDKVSILDITSKAQLSDYLSGLFSAEITEKLMKTTVGSEKHPLFIDGEDGLYRFGGYVGQFNFSDLDIKLTISELTASDAILNAKAETTIYSDLDPIKFEYDYEIFLDSDGKWKLNSFVLPDKKIADVFFGYDDGGNREDDTTKITINDISDWAKLEFTGIGSEQLRQYIEAFVNGDHKTLASLSKASDPAVFEEYAALDITDYSISKIYSAGQSKLRFDYTIGDQRAESSIRTTGGDHSVYVIAGQNGIYLTDTDESEPTELEGFLSDYFASTLNHEILDCNDLSYSQNLDITEFLLKRLGGYNISESDITGLAYIIFGVYTFSPSEDLRNEDGTFSITNRANRGIGFDIISEYTIEDEINITVQFYADESKLVPAFNIDYQLRQNGADYKFVGFYKSHDTGRKIYKNI